jgi:acyl-CoA thioesterase
VNYNNAQPSLSTTLVYENEQVKNKIVVDYSGSLFNNDHQVVNSTKKVEVYSGDKLLSSTVVAYDEHGKKLKDTDPKAVKIKSAKPVKPSKAPEATGNTAKGISPSYKPKAKPDKTNTTQQTNITRNDGTLQETRVTTLQKDKPVSALITMYAADGKTVTKTFTLDLTSLAYDQNSKIVTGALNMQAHLGGNILQSESSIQY